MATIAGDFAERKMSVGRVFDRAFATIRHKPLIILGLGLLFAALPVAGLELLGSRVAWGAVVLTVGSLALPGFFARFILNWFAGLVIGTIVQGAMTLPVVAEHEGRKVGFGESFGAAFHTLIPLTLMGAMIGVSVIVGTTLLIVPGIFIYLFWSLAPSAEVDEREGLFLSLSRSQELGEGARWKMFAIVLILLAITLLFVFITAWAVFALMMGNWTGYESQTARFVLRTALGAIVDIIWGTVLASLYVELKQWKEGGSAENLEQVFA